MPIMFNSLLRDEGLSAADVRLLRHQDQRAAKGRTPYQLWRDNFVQFEAYQSTQSTESRTRALLTAPYWASFVVTPHGETLFVGLYSAKYRGLLQEDAPRPQQEGIDQAGSCDVYEVTLQKAMSDLIGKLFIDWGPGFRTWIQRADLKIK